jgi:hypothetical protein
MTGERRPGSLKLTSMPAVRALVAAVHDLTHVRPRNRKVPTRAWRRLLALGVTLGSGLGLAAPRAFAGP